MPVTLVSSNQAIACRRGKSQDLTPVCPPNSPVAVEEERRRALRKVLLDRRRALSEEVWRRDSQRVCEFLQAAFPQLAACTVGFCWPVAREPDLRPLLAIWARAARPGFCAALPVVVAAQQPLAFRAWSPGAAMVADRYGIPTPASGDLVVPAALLLPMNGFDAAGYRIGYGGGYFDRTLASLSPRPLAIGVAFEIARLASIEPQEHDQPVDVIVTEAGVFAVDGSCRERPRTNSASGPAGIGRAIQ